MLLELAGGLTIAIWVYILLARRAEWRTARADTPNSWPSVVAIVPARDEGQTIAAAVASLHAQDYRGEFHIVVVDDDSRDATAQKAREAAPPSRLTVARANRLPAGWTGKLWAMSEGVRHAAPFRPEYILFTDADIVHPPDNLRGLVARAQQGNYALVSYMATLRCRTIGEIALVPAFVFFFFLLYPPRSIRNPHRREAGAAGGCILLRRDRLEKIGGLDAIRGNLIDDCALAAAVKQSGGQIWLGLSEQTRSIRDYRTFGEVGRMISRTAFTQLRYSAVLLAGTLLAMAVTFLAPPALALAAPQPARGMGALAWLLMCLAYLPALRYYRRSPLWAVFLPVIALFYAACTLHSAVAHWRGVGGLWKGRGAGNLA
jgi:hopene-associated glycosyltransferase HpnB